jgi:hypothetical protein
VFVKIGNDAKDFSFEGVEPLWIRPYRCIVGFTGGPIAAFEIEDTPFRIAGTSRRIEDQITHGMGTRIELDAQDLSRRSFKSRIGRIRVRPFDQDAFVLKRARRLDRLCRCVTGNIQPGEMRVVGEVRARQCRVLNVNGVELAGFCVIRIEVKTVQAVSITVHDRQLVKDSRLA